MVCYNAGSTADFNFVQYVDINLVQNNFWHCVPHAYYVTQATAGTVAEKRYNFEEDVQQIFFKARKDFCSNPKVKQYVDPAKMG